MPSPARSSSKKSSTSKKRRPDRKASHIAFFPVLVLIFIMWMLYRSIFTFPVWFDESIGKLLFFAVPIWLFVTMTGHKGVVESFAPTKARRGLLLGIAAGGLFGFVASILSFVSTGAMIEAVPIFTAPNFWGEFVLAMMTGFFETLLFYSFAMTLILEKYPRWSLLRQSLTIALIFLVFHIPNALLRFELPSMSGVFLLLFLFALGQAYLFAARKNAYAIVLTHAIWGMVLLVYGW